MGTRKLATLAAAIGLAVLTTAASATTIHVVTTDTADGDNTTGYDFGGSLLSIDFTFDVGPGAPSASPAFSNVSGTATWTDGGAMSFTATGAQEWSQSSSGVYGIAFTGPGTALPGGSTLNWLILNFAIAENPFTTTTNLSDLLLSGSVMTIGTYITGSLGGQISASVTTSSITEVAPVPLPASLPMILLAIGAVGTLGWRRTRAA